MQDPIGFLKQLACMLPVMLLSLTMHEWGHAYAAYKCGDDTARNFGRMTLNPLKHIDPIGFLMVLIAGFGWAKPVPVNPRNYRNYKTGEAIVSLAGVTMNFLLAIAFSIALIPLFRMYASGQYSWLENGILIDIIVYGISLNLILMLFNLIPIYPLDGYHIFELLFARRLPMSVFLFLRRYGQYILIGILILFNVIDFHPISDLIGKIVINLMNFALRI
ncbi:MAG: site-2 protease family protein [Clostridia bacterium]|nr:site-2 protease family protein [Clostridia bacterium]